MSVFKRLFCFMFSLVLILSFSACSEDEKTKIENNKSEPEIITIKDEEIKLNSANLSQAALETSLSKQDFQGLEITYYTTKEPSSLLKSKLAAFSKAHNCTVRVVLDSVGSIEGLATSIASGTPYDIIENDINSFSKTVFYNIYEPLQNHIDPIDYYSAERSGDCGISNAFASRFNVNDQLLAVGSAESVDFYVLYYNRALFNESEFIGLQTLWETGRWSLEDFSNMSTVTSLISGQSLLQLPSFSDWLNIKCIDILKFENGNIINLLKEEKTILAATDYRNLIYGDLPFSVPKSGVNSFKNGKAYSVIDKASNVSFWRESAKNSPAFENNADNLGYVVLPSDISVSGAQPAANVRCYSALKGTKHPTAAPCFALFESRIFEDQNTEDEFVQKIIPYLKSSFNENGFLPNLNFTDEKNTNSITSVLDENGISMRDGETGRMVLVSVAPKVDELIKASSKVTLPDTNKEDK